jgi:hypothetical protein
VARLGQSFPYKLGAVIAPGGKNSCLFFRILRFQEPENAWVIIIRRFDVIVPYMMLVDPGPGQQAVVSYR